MNQDRYQPTAEGESKRRFYDCFHSNSASPLGTISSSDFVYRNIVKSLRLLGIKKSDSLLDYGCGNGVLTYYLASEYSCHVTGIDISGKAISKARESPLYGKLSVSFVTGDISQVHSKERFDKIICSEVIEHVDDDGLLLENFSNLLKEDGMLFLTTQLKSAPLHRLKVRIFGIDAFDSNVGHLRRYSAEELVDLLSREKFSVEKLLKAEGVLRNWMFTAILGQRTMRLFKKSGLLAGLSFLDDHIFRYLGESQVIVIARKKPKED